MKHYLFLLHLSLLSFFSFGQQWTTSGSNIYNSNTGFVGIGTTTPTNKLQVVYNSSLTTAATGTYSVMNQAATNTATVTSFGSTFKATHPSGTIVQAIAIGGTCEINGAGNVTHLKGIQGIAYISGSGSATNAYGLVGGVSITGTGTVTNGYGVIVNSFPSGVTNKWGFYVSDATAKNHFAGAVTIGTTSDFGYKLAVNGSAIFTEAKVKPNANWPDYVFHKNYKLLPLKELEKFVRQNHHLPNIPTAEQVKENGIELGNMSSKLLEKIEELTLYVIELKKENELLKKRLDSIEAGKEK